MKLANVESCYYFSPEDAEVEVIDWELVGGLSLTYNCLIIVRKKSMEKLKQSAIIIV